MSEGKVSIITPMFNDALYIKETIESVLSQTYPDWEMIIIDDCSDDRCLDVVNSFDDRRIIVLRNKARLGAAASRNIGLRLASGTWVSFLDSDDTWMPEKLEKQVNFMIKNKFNFSYTFYQEKINNSVIAIDRGPYRINQRSMFLCDYIGCLTVMYNREKVGLIQVDQRITKRNDYAIWLQISKKFECYCLDEILASYRIKKSSVSHVSKIKLLKAHFILYKYQEHFSFIKSWFFAFRNAIITELYKKKRYRRLVNDNNKII